MVVLVVVAVTVAVLVSSNYSRNSSSTDITVPNAIPVDPGGPECCSNIVANSSNSTVKHSSNVWVNINVICIIQYCVMFFRIHDYSYVVILYGVVYDR